MPKTQPPSHREVPPVSTHPLVREAEAAGAELSRGLAGLDGEISRTEAELADAGKANERAGADALEQGLDVARGEVRAHAYSGAAKRLAELRARREKVLRALDQVRQNRERAVAQASRELAEQLRPLVTALHQSQRDLVQRLSDLQTEYDQMVGRVQGAGYEWHLPSLPEALGRIDDGSSSRAHHIARELDRLLAPAPNAAGARRAVLVLCDTRIDGKAHAADTVIEVDPVTLHRHRDELDPHEEAVAAGRERQKQRASMKPTSTGFFALEMRP